MCLDLSLTHKVIPGWLEYEKGIEILSTSLTSIDQRTVNGKKGLTFADLLIKVHPDQLVPIHWLTHELPADSTSLQIPAPL